MQSEQSSPKKRIPVKLHRNVSLIRVNEPHVVDELMSRKRLAKLFVGRLGDDLILVRPGFEDAVLDELCRIGHKPQVIRARAKGNKRIE